MKSKTPPGTWLNIGTDMVSLGMDTAAVIGLRMAKFARGGSGAFREAAQMVSEKVEATAHLQLALLSGRLGSTPASIAKHSLRYCSVKVKANRRRLAAMR